MNYLSMENALARHLHREQQAQMDSARLRGELRLSMTASPAYRLEEGGGEVSWDTFTCRVFRQDGQAVCQLEMGKAQGRCVATGDRAELVDFSWVPIQVMKAWPYREGEDPLACLGSYPPLPAPGINRGEDVLAIRNVQNLFFEHRLHRLEELFSASPRSSLMVEFLGITGEEGLPGSLEQCRRWLKREEENGHCYLVLGVTGLPVIEVDAGGERASGLFMTQLYQCRARACRENPEEWTLGRTLAVAQGEYVKENGAWKILTLEIRNLVDLPDVPYSTTGRYDKSGQSLEPWEVDQVPGPVPVLEDAMEAENIINGWVYGCRRGELPAFLETYMANPQGDNWMLIRSYGAATPVLDCYEKIAAKITDMTSQYCPGYYTFHAPTTPVIRSLGPDEMLGTWFDCAATNLRSMADSPRAVPYMAFVNKYVHRFRRIQGRWYLTKFKAEPLISLPDWELDMMENTGWLTAAPQKEFPAPFQRGSQP